MIGENPLSQPCGYLSTTAVEGYELFLEATRELAFMLLNGSRGDSGRRDHLPRSESDQAERRRGASAGTCSLLLR